ncbi:MAG TPA: hypothetical protein VM123_16395 [archaeon]|nr:hypothetical protein [archaeon]
MKIDRWVEKAKGLYEKFLDLTIEKISGISPDKDKIIPPVTLELPDAIGVELPDLLAGRQQKLTLPGMPFPGSGRRGAKNNLYNILGSLLETLAKGPAGGSLSSGYSQFPGNLANSSIPGLDNGVSFDLLSGDSGDKALQSIGRIQARYGEMVDMIISGNQSALSSISGLFQQLEARGWAAADSTGSRFARLQGDIFGGMGDYAARLGSLTGLASKAFAALSSMNPFAASAASVALLALGKALKSLASFSGSSGSTYSGGYSTAGAYGSTGANQDSGAGNTWTGPQVVNVYINGLKSANPYEVDRTLNRAGVDRELRQRIRELVRTGSNPIRE